MVEHGKPGGQDAFSRNIAKVLVLGDSEVGKSSLIKELSTSVYHHVDSSNATDGGSGAIKRPLSNQVSQEHRRIDDALSELQYCHGKEIVSSPIFR